MVQDEIQSWKTRQMEMETQEVYIHIYTYYTHTYTYTCEEEYACQEAVLSF